MLAAITTCRLFSHLGEPQLRALRERYSWVGRSIASGEVVFLAGDPIDAFVAIGSGAFAAQMPDEGGRTMLVEMLGKGDSIGATLLFSSSPFLPVTVSAATHGSIVTLRRQEFVRLLAAEQSIMERFLRDAGDRIAFLAEKIRLLRFATLSQKVAGYLLRLAREQAPDEPSVHVELPQTLDVLADLFGVARPSLSRCIAGMCERGLMQRVGRRAFAFHTPTLRQALDE